MFDIPAELYPKIFQGLVFILCLFVVIRYSASNDNRNLLNAVSGVPACVLCLLLVLFLGLRPVNSRIFGDSYFYALNYNNFYNLTLSYINVSEEWLFHSYTFFCKSMGLSVNMYFTGIELGYIGCLVLACRKLLWEATWVALLFCISAFSFWGYGVNGLRNGWACSVIILAISFLAQRKKYFISIILAVGALGLHRSTMLPIVACVGAVVIIKQPRTAMFFWLLSIPVSFLAGNQITKFFADLGFDNRMESYQLIDSNVSFSSYGFRWDFLLYSAMPVLLTWYVHKRVDETGGYKEDGSTALADANSMRVFNILSGTYILANSFWILVINANFSNRFAYLSWFLYPIVLAYGFLRLHIWKDQDRKCAWALFAHAGFTFGMFLIGKL